MRITIRLVIYSVLASINVFAMIAPANADCNDDWYDSGMEYNRVTNAQLKFGFCAAWKDVERQRYASMRLRERCPLGDSPSEVAKANDSTQRLIDRDRGRSERECQ
jgi:hypothetical protein